MVLLTKRLTIRHYTKGDLVDFNAILTNDTVMKGIRGKGYSIDVASEKFEEALQINGAQKDLGFFNVTLKGSDTLIGFAKLVSTEDECLELGYALTECQWGLGYASEITAALVEHAQNTYPEKEIIGIVNIDNEASKKVLLKQGFKFKRTDTLDGFEVAYFYLPK